MKGLWENGFAGVRPEKVSGDTIQDIRKKELRDLPHILEKELRGLASKLEALYSTIDDSMNEVIEENVEDALKEYAKEANVLMTDEPGVFEVQLWYDEEVVVATIPVDIREELDYLADLVEDLPPTDPLFDRDIEKAHAWADELERLATRLRRHRPNSQSQQPKS